MTEENHAIGNARGWLETIQELVLKINDDGLTEERREEAEQEIHDGPLSVMVRDGWYRPGDHTRCEDGPEEYEILLSTGGPALRIYGRLGSFNEPDDNPRLQWQDWGVPWTDYPMDAGECKAVAAYAQQFYFGD